MTKKDHNLRVHRRTLLLTLAAAGLVALILVELVQLQWMEAATFRKQARGQQESLISLTPSRGAIFDTRGRELAVTLEVDSLYADPGRLQNATTVSRQLAKILGQRSADIRKQLSKEGKHFTWVARKVSPKTRARIEELNIDGLGFLAENKRFYPKRQLASHVLGYVGIDNQGLAGLEYQFDQQIRGQAGKRLAYRDAEGIRIPMQVHQPPTEGLGLVLTVDEVIQHIVERELQAAVRSSRARAGIAILMDPNSGDILALANHPTYDPNQFASYPKRNLRNLAISDCFEPGSTFKVFTMAAARRGGRLREGELIDCRDGSIRIAGRTIRDHKPFGKLTPREILVHSSNVGAIEIGRRIPNQAFYKQLQVLGFGSRTGMGLPGENPGILHPPREWSRTSYASLSIGHEVCVTPLQLTAALSAAINGGILRKPRIIRAIVDQAGMVVDRPAEGTATRAIPEGVSDRLRMDMTEVVQEGTGQAAWIPGYTVGGKTGTAQKVESDGRYSSTRFVASFFGFVPAERPAIALLVVLDEPQGNYYGGETAAPVFARIAPPVLRYLRVPPDPGRSASRRTLARAERGSTGVRAAAR